MEARIAASELFPSLHQIKAPSFSFYHSQQSFRFAHPLSHSNHQYVLCSASRCLRHCRLGRSRCAHWRSRDVPFPQTRTQPPRLLAQVRRQAHEDLRRLLRLLQLLLRRAGHVGAERRRLPLRRHQRRQVLDGPGKPPLPHDHYSKKKILTLGFISSTSPPRRTKRPGPNSKAAASTAASPPNAARRKKGAPRPARARPSRRARASTSASSRTCWGPAPASAPSGPTRRATARG